MASRAVDDLTIGPTPTAKAPLQVFLCHASGDKPAVRELHQKLLRAGVKPWLDEEDLLAGQDWAAEIRRVMREIDIVLVYLSNASVNKTGFVQTEIKYALDRADEQPEGEIFVIPVRGEECRVPSRLGHLHAVDLHVPGGYARLLRAFQERATSLGKAMPRSPE
jgi:TIR domain